MRNERKNGVRQAIVDTASRLFYKQGYVNTGINQIIAESGVVKSTLYTAFRTKEDILMEYLVQSGAATDAALKLAAEKGKDDKGKVLAVFDYLIDLVQEKEFYGCNFLNLISEIPTDAERVIKQIQKQKNGVRKLFASLLEPMGKEELADEIYILFEGALIANKVHNKVWPVDAAKKIAAKLIS
ncbi:TetR/AcrR family transcriptional regulator [Mucilaginibacter sabulilitoris]|uniref:TetR/AcrR family transcriptional regulator n=1 Tax=Mucilaginibacter sabulilitoris TaxID=1173583 RepID=A0ABZ0TPS8_9SPHI|nr:TetR/AcrR family transcriptional regulator [Mucilaginibacter sabulilitoris]WPU94786.1 TetR/AcrR family transcriptional regulator [Mucilaginibacter sabulilitoris]